MTTPNSTDLNRQPALQSTIIADALVTMLKNLGVECAFGVMGGAIAPTWIALENENSEIQVFQCRHEGGAAFAGVEAHFASNRPVVVFATTGPGITNALTGLFAARWENAKIIFLSAVTPDAKRGRLACQETSDLMPGSELLVSNSLFHYTKIVKSAQELPEIRRQLASGLAQPGGFIAHLGISPTVQSSPVEMLSSPVEMRSSSLRSSLSKVSLSPLTITPAEIEPYAKLLLEGNFAIWVGYGARKAADSIRQLAERSGAAVMCSPRGKGIFPEDHSQFVGVTGFAGHQSVFTYMEEYCPMRTLVLGTRLGEFTSFWERSLVPQQGFIHVDIDPKVPGTAYPEVKTLPVQSDVGLFVEALLEHFPEDPKPLIPAFPNPERTKTKMTHGDRVNPERLMEDIQEVIVEGSEALVMPEPGNSFAWAINKLHFNQPNRFRTSTSFASMGHNVAGVVGAAAVVAIAADKPKKPQKAVAIVGDGAMLMNNEISTAVQYQLPAVWIVLNDSAYNMVEQVMPEKKVNDLVQMPETNFVQIARGMGADGIRVTQECKIRTALKKAMKSSVPFVVDVTIDPTKKAPIGTRLESLKAQGATQ